MVYVESISVSSVNDIDDAVQISDVCCPDAVVCFTTTVCGVFVVIFPGVIVVAEFVSTLATDVSDESKLLSVASEFVDSVTNLAVDVA